MIAAEGFWNNGGFHRSYAAWKDKVPAFKRIDVRGIQGNFFQGIRKQAMRLPEGSGVEIVQSFDLLPLYEVM